MKLLAVLLTAVSALQPLDRRATLQGFAAATTTSLIPLPPATAAATIATALKTVSWSATDGFDSDFPSQINFIEFDEKAYRAMRDDPRRTPKFAKAIRSRLAELQDAVVLDLGTGPFCVLALIAATAGAKKVYAVEANPEAARRAKAFIAKCEDPNASRRDVDGLVPLKPGLIEVIEGFSTELTLPAVWKSKFYGPFVLNHRVVLHAVDATPARWRGDAGSSPLDRASTAASSPRNDLVKNYGCTDTLVDFHTGCPKRSTSASSRSVGVWRPRRACTRR